MSWGFFRVGGRWCSARSVVSTWMFVSVGTSVGIDPIRWHSSHLTTDSHSHRLHYFNNDGTRWSVSTRNWGPRRASLRRCLGPTSPNYAPPRDVRLQSSALGSRRSPSHRMGHLRNSIQATRLYTRRNSFAPTSFNPFLVKDVRRPVKRSKPSPPQLSATG